MLLLPIAGPRFPVEMTFLPHCNPFAIGRWLNSTNKVELQQIDDTVGVMRENISKVSQRGERLDSLQDKTDNLAVSAQGFRRGANRVRKQMWWKDMKMRMCLLVGIIVLLIVIIVPAGGFYNFAFREIL